MPLPFLILYLIWWNLHADNYGGAALSVQNKETYVELTKKKKKLNKMKEKVKLNMVFDSVDLGF